MDNLKPCPFCGGEVSIKYISDDNCFCIWHKDDTRCRFLEPFWIDGQYAKSLNDARSTWNMRINKEGDKHNE